MKYRKKPIVVEAIQWTGTNHEQIKDFCGSVVVESGETYGERGAVYYFAISTLEGKMYVSVGDFIIKGIAGEFYACKPEVFKASYDEVLGCECHGVDPENCPVRGALF